MEGKELKIKWTKYNYLHFIKMNQEEKEKFFEQLQEINRKEKIDFLTYIINEKDKIKTIFWNQDDTRSKKNTFCIYIFYSNQKTEPFFIDKTHQHFWNFLYSICQ